MIDRSHYCRRGWGRQMLDRNNPHLTLGNSRTRAACPDQTAAIGIKQVIAPHLWGGREPCCRVGTRRARCHLAWTTTPTRLLAGRVSRPVIVTDAESLKTCAVVGATAPITTSTARPTASGPRWHCTVAADWRQRPTSRSEERRGGKG